MNASLLGLSAASYVPHPLHVRDRVWTQSNCWVDLVIEVLSAHGLDPHASLPFTFALDFEGDQWLFFKQPVADLTRLHGLAIHELTIWRPLLDHVVEQTSRGRMVLVELDAHFLPDTEGLTYRVGHSKTTIGIESIDRQARRLGYFHNDGYFELAGDDFVGLFGIADPPLLPPYAEFVKFDRLVRRPVDELVTLSRELLGEHLTRLPTTNPITRYAARFDTDRAWLVTEPHETFHQYSFATLRQLGACFELGGSYLRWLESHGETGLDRAVDACERIANGAKSLQFQLARATMRKKPLDASGAFAEMAEAWDLATTELVARHAR